MKQDGSLALFQYWNSLRGHRPAPDHAEIKPVKIKKYLQDILILGHEADETLTFRLAGTRICAHYGKELRGKRVETLWTSSSRVRVRRLMQQVIEQQCAISISFEGVSKNNRTALFEFIALPLHSGEYQTRVLGIIQAVEQLYWLGRDPIIYNRLIDVAVINLHGNRAARPTLRYTSSSNFLQTSSDDLSIPKIRHLTVIEGDRYK